MIDKNEALFVVRLPAGQKTIPYERVPELIALAQARAKSPDYDPDNVSGDEEVIFLLNVWLEQDALKAAARSGEVEVLDNSFRRLSAGRLENGLLTVRALRGYLESIHGFLEVEDAPEPEAAPVLAASAPGGKERAEAGPLPLTTGDIAFCFAGLRWDEQQWKKPLGDKPKWLAACIAIPGVRGVSETRWSPVCIGAALVRAGHAKPNSVRAKFQTQPLLTPWLDEWKTYEADNLSAD